MTSRCSSDMAATKVHRTNEEGAGSAPTRPKGRLVHYQRFTEMPYINPAIPAILTYATQWKALKEKK